MKNKKMKMLVMVAIIILLSTTFSTSIITKTAAEKPPHINGQIGQHGGEIIEIANPNCDECNGVNCIALYKEREDLGKEFDELLATLEYLEELLASKRADLANKEQILAKEQAILERLESEEARIREAIRHLLVMIEASKDCQDYGETGLGNALILTYYYLKLEALEEQLHNIQNQIQGQLVRINQLQIAIANLEEDIECIIQLMEDILNRMKDISDRMDELDAIIEECCG